MERAVAEAAVRRGDVSAFCVISGAVGHGRGFVWRRVCSRLAQQGYYSMEWTVYEQIKELNTIVRTLTPFKPAKTITFLFLQGTQTDYKT